MKQSMTGMDYKIQEVAQRIRELREISGFTTAEMAMRQLDKLKGCEAHSSVILSGVDASTFRKLGLNVTCEPRYQTKKLYHK